MPDHAYPGPNLDYLHEMNRFFEYWLKGIDNGSMREPAFTFSRREYTEPEAFPAMLNSEWLVRMSSPWIRLSLMNFFLAIKLYPSKKQTPHPPTII